MALKLLALLSALWFAALILPMTFTSDVEGPYDISLVVYNSLTNEKNLTFGTEIAYRGILLGAMMRIANETNFTFETSYNNTYGPFLESVNGIKGGNNTYWELLAKRPDGTIIRPDVGIGCFIPGPNYEVILKYTKW